MVLIRVLWKNRFVAEERAQKDLADERRLAPWGRRRRPALPTPYVS